MKSRKWLWISCAALCAIAVAIGVLTRSRGEIETLRSLHPKETLHMSPDGRKSWTFDFQVPPEQVMALLPLPKGAKPGDYIPRFGGFPIYEFPSGDGFTFEVWDGWGRRDGVTCSVTLSDGDFNNGKKRPWLDRTWLTIKQRLGLWP